MTLTAFLPCRAGSQRVPHKNTRPFGGEPDGLLGIKLRQLLAVPEIDRVMLSTNDAEVLRIAAPHIAGSGGRLVVDHRPDHLCSSETSTDQVIAHVPRVIEGGDVLWTHVTSPFFGVAEYSAAIAAYRAALAAGTHDSLMGVLEIRSFVWMAGRPVNYDRAVEKWPRTQTLPPVHEVNSSIFIAPREVYTGMQDRIGATPLAWAVDKDKSLDVDWEEDFHLASKMWELRNAQSRL